jgi:hypothetical protein
MKNWIFEAYVSSSHSHRHTVKGPNTFPPPAGFFFLCFVKGIKSSRQKDGKKTLDFRAIAEANLQNVKNLTGQEDHGDFI